MIATTTPILSNESLIPTAFGELQARPQVVDFGKFIAHPEFRLGQMVISKTSRERGRIDSMTLFMDAGTGMPEWSYSVRYFGDSQSYEVETFGLEAAVNEPMVGEEVFLPGTKVLSPDDPANCGGIVLEVRYDEKEGYWEHKVLWASGKIEWMDCELYAFDPDDYDPLFDQIPEFPTRYGIASGKTGAAFLEVTQ